MIYCIHPKPEVSIFLKILHGKEYVPPVNIRTSHNFRILINCPSRFPLYVSEGTPPPARLRRVNSSNLPPLDLQRLPTIAEAVPQQPVPSIELPDIVIPESSSAMAAPEVRSQETNSGAIWRCYFLSFFTSYFMFSIAALPDSPGVLYFHLFLRRDTRILGVAAFSLQIGTWDLFVHRGQKSYIPTAFEKLWTTPGVRCMKHASS